MRRDIAERRWRRRLIGAPELHAVESEANACSTLEFLILCEFLAGFSIDQVAGQYRISSTGAQDLMRAALLQYGFDSQKRR
jgi:hypothetical protein